jgi:hypothetical protein
MFKKKDWSLGAVTFSMMTRGIMPFGLATLGMVKHSPIMHGFATTDVRLM